NDKASSVKVPSGWSVRLYADSDRNGSSICFNSDVSDFGTQGNFPGTGTSLNDNTSSIEVFSSSSNCGNPTPPSTPSNPNPSDSTMLERTNDTTLSWSTNGTNCT